MLHQSLDHEIRHSRGWTEATMGPASPPFSIARGPGSAGDTAHALRPA